MNRPYTSRNPPVGAIHESPLRIHRSVRYRVDGWDA